MLGLDLGVIDWSDPKCARFSDAYARFSDAIVVNWSGNGFSGGSGVTVNGEEAGNASLLRFLEDVIQDIFFIAHTTRRCSNLHVVLVMKESKASSFRSFIPEFRLANSSVYIGEHLVPIILEDAAGDNIYMLTTHLNGRELFELHDDSKWVCSAPFLQAVFFNVRL